MIKGIIFDLDFCILDTHSLTGPFFDPVLDPLRHSSLPDDQKVMIEQQLWSMNLEDAIVYFGIPRDIADAMREAYKRIEVPEGIRSYGDEFAIRDLPVKKYLVTSGYRRFQATKIEQLGIASLFDTVIIDELDDPVIRKGKKEIFIEILQRERWQPPEVIVVGDSPKSELGAAKHLGITTVQTVRPTIKKWDEADHHITSLSELKALL